MSMLLYSFHPLYWLMIGPGLLLALYATMRTKTTFAKYSRLASQRGFTGAEAAAEMLRRSNVDKIAIKPTRGTLTDHYNPATKTLRLSEGVYGSRSLAAIGIACHEAGHAIQDAQGFAALGLRIMLVPITNICSTFYIWVIIIGFVTGSMGLARIGVYMCSAAVVFALVTLPVEWDASRRAKLAMTDVGLLYPDETRQAAKVLDAAFLTYVASAVTAVLTLLYWLMRLGLLGGGDD